ncbi:MAG TPA: hypothetical protein VM536_07005 [Chloroflexia bacterium]|nr:hypothetical protein [Chloroflexia bacterium]
MALMVVDPRAAFAGQLETYQRRLRRTRRRDFLASAAVGVAALWLLASGLVLFDAPLLTVLLGAGVGTVLLLAGAWALEAWRRPSLLQMAARLDALLDNRQRVVTAVELLQSNARTAFVDEQLAGTADLLAQLAARGGIPARPAPPRLLTAAGLLCCALGLVVVKGLPAAFTPLAAGPPPPTVAAAGLPSPTAESGLPPGTPPPGAPAPPPAAAEPTAAAGSAAQASGSQPPGSGQEALDRLADALEGQSLTSQAADSLRQGDVGDAATRLAGVGEQNDQLSPAARDGLADALRDAAAGSPGSPDLQGAEERAATALERGNYEATDEALKDLADAVREAGTPAAAATPGAAAAAATAAAAGQTPQAGPATPAAGGTQPGNGTQAAPGVGGDGPSDEGPQGRGSPGDTPGGAPGDTPSDQAGGQGGGTGSGTRVSGAADTRALDAAGKAFELEGRPQPGGGRAGSPDQPPGLTVDESVAGGAPAGSAPAAGGAGTLPGENNRVPLERWPVVERYFDPDQ